MAKRSVKLSYSENTEFETEAEISTGMIIIKLEISDHSYIMIPVTKEEALEMATILIASIRDVIK